MELLKTMENNKTIKDTGGIYKKQEALCVDMEKLQEILLSRKK